MSRSLGAMTLEDVIAARTRLGGAVAATPCSHSETLSALTGSRVFVKLENLQRIEKTLVEGAGAVRLAALVNKRVALPGKTVALVLSGGNIDVNLISRIIERGLVKDGRVARLAVTLRDRPGALAQLTGLVAEARVNVLHIHHDRTFSRARVGESPVELTLETSGREQIETLKRSLAQAGYAVEEVTRGFPATS